ncbi:MULTISPECIES: hypothetical protein [Streptomyces]|uniref:hypothetical protein n=1 Tax=Streptomyces TaxID=1883 RepID=UPI002250C604|nr:MULTISPECIES: hypothetical protein [Streptomyces]MCX5278113.1 hypothetical protein [Streptomyces virginiae]
MADTWILGTTLHENRSGQLVRADDVSHLLATGDSVTASRIGSDDAVTLAHKDAVGLEAPAPSLPEDFHLALLVTLGKARKQARDSEEDLVVVPGIDDNKEWDWTIVPISELWTG